LQKTGIQLAVIDGDLEARLTLNGVLSGLDSNCSSLAVLDVGGGSTEFTVSSQGVPTFIKSMPIGVVRLTEGFRSVNEMADRVQLVINQLYSDMFAAGITISAESELVGTGNTPHAIKMEMIDYDYHRVNNLVQK
jgi:exopolyphosphatase/guanosine-5'-triphosphate,3'-diphosphate pyrophosphatase